MAKPDFENAYGWNPANSNYKDGNESIGTIYLTGAGYINEPFSGIGIESQFGWEEMVWKKNPNRGQSFAFSNMDTIDVGLVARCEVSIPYMNYDKLKILREIVKQRYFEARFFNVDTGEWITREVYCTEQSKSKLYILKQSLIGSFGCTIKLVGTNRDMKDLKVSVTYDLTDPITGISYSGDVPSVLNVSRGTQIVIGENSTIAEPTYWVEYDNANKVITKKYYPNKSVTVWKSATLYPRFE